MNAVIDSTPQQAAARTPSPAALVPRSNGVRVAAGAMSPIELGEVLARSGFFEDSKDAAQAAVKVMAGAELGFGPVASMTGIHIVRGKVQLGAQLMGAAIKAHPRYDYRVVELDDEHAKIEFFDRSESVGFSEWSMADAQKTGVVKPDSAWKTYPRQMLAWRALSNGAKLYAPDAFGGGPVYLPDEIDSDDLAVQLVEGADAGRLAELEAEVERLTAALVTERERQVAAVPVLDNAGQEQVVKDLEARWPHYDAVKFLTALERRSGGAIPEAAGAAVRAWAWFVAQPFAHRSEPQQEPEPPPVSG